MMVLDSGLLFWATLQSVLQGIDGWAWQYKLYTNRSYYC